MDNSNNPGRKSTKIIWMIILAVIFLIPDCFLGIRDSIIKRKLKEYNRESYKYLLEELNEQKIAEEKDSTDVSNAVSETADSLETLVALTSADVTTETYTETTAVSETASTISADSVKEEVPDAIISEPVENNTPDNNPVIPEGPVQQYVQPVPEPEPEPAGQPEVQNVSYSYEQSEILRIINEIRLAHGLQGFMMSDQVNAAAMIRAEETTRSFSHIRPDGRDCFSVASDLGISAMTMGENIACGNSLPEKTVEQWMNSEGHRNNILNPSFTTMGVGFVRASDVYGYYWTQFFTG